MFRIRVRKVAAGAILLAAVVLVGACGGVRPRQAAYSDYPLDRAQAAVELARRGDCRGLDLLINLLEDEAAAVRMYAINSLERLCGRDYGYHYYDPPAQRKAAVARWREARRSGELERLCRQRGQAPAPVAEGEGQAG